MVEGEFDEVQTRVLSDIVGGNLEGEIVVCRIWDGQGIGIYVVVN